jgi:hypothetical protein
MSNVSRWPFSFPKPPGDELAREAARRLSARFSTAFKAPAKVNEAPAWLVFDQVHSIRRLQRQELRLPFERDGDAMFVLWESKRRVFRCSLEDAAKYAEMLWGGHHPAVYIIDESMSWCVAVTDEDDQGVDIVLWVRR